MGNVRSLSDSRRHIAYIAAMLVGVFAVPIATLRAEPASGAKVVVQLVDEQGKALTNQSISMMPLAVGCQQARPGRPYHADKAGIVTIESVSPGEHQYVLRQNWPVPTIVTLRVPATGLQTKVVVKKGELPGGIPDLDIKAVVHEKDGKRTVDVAITNNTERPYELTSTDLQLVSGDYRIFPPPSAATAGGKVPAKSKGSQQLALDWDEYVHQGLWASRSGEEISEPTPAAPAGEGLAYYRVDVGNCYSLPVILPKLDEFKGRVIDHAGKDVAGAAVYLASGQVLELSDGKNGMQPGVPSQFNGSRTVTDKDGRFALTGVGGDRIVVVAGEMVWLTRMKTGKEQTVQLPQPGKVTISYDIEGAAKEGVFRLEFKSWDMPEWRGVAQTSRYVKCNNGGTLEVAGLEPGEYDVCRWVDNLRAGDIGHTGMLDRGTLTVEAGKAAKLEYVRATGCPVAGQVVGLKEAGLAGAFVWVRHEKATGDPQRMTDEWKLPVFDALATGPDGQFKTSRLSPGTYMVAAEAYKPEDPSQGFTSGWRLPELVGKVKAVVPQSGEVKPIRIELAPRSAEKPAAPATQPAS